MGEVIDVVLASASPRRLELLKSIGVEFRVLPSEVDEPEWHGGNPAAYARRLAVAKAQAVAVLAPRAIVIGADTIVVCRGEVLGKPAGIDDAMRMLRCLSGMRHEVITGLAIVAGNGLLARQIIISHEQTIVEFRPMSEQEITDYIDTGEPFDKAGGYGIQGKASLFIRRIEGCYSNVVGLPLQRLGRLLSDCGVPLLGNRQ
jgi:septum formation protein